jgi:hypothetical protein
MTSDYEERLRAKLAPETIRVILSYAGLVLLLYEELKREVVDQVREFYTFDETLEEADYARDVRSLNPSPFRASAQWLLKNGAITVNQIEVLERLYEHRKDVAHELIKYLIDVDSEIDAGLFIQALEVLKNIRKFWAQVALDEGLILVDRDAGTIEVAEGITADEIAPLSSLVLQNVFDAWVEGVRREQRAPTDPDEDRT